MAADPAVGRADAGLRTKAAPEAQAAQLLFERHGDRVLAYCRRRLSSPEEAEDALQTTFLYACRGLQRGVVPETEIAWLLKIAHNVCLSHWDSDRRRRRLELVRDPERLEASTPTAAGSRDDLHALEAALAGLTDLQRRAIVLREWRGLSYAEIAAELELSQAAVETLIFRARRALATSLEEQDVGRSRLARALDFGGLLASLKSLLGGGGAAKVAATGLAVGVAVLAGSIPDVPKRAAAEPPARSVGAPATVDPATAPSARAAAAAAAARSASEPAAKAKRAEQRKPQRAPAKPGQSSPQQPTVGETVGQVTTGLGGTVNGTVEAVTGTVNGTVGTVTETVNGTVGTVNGTVNGTVGTLPQVVEPTLEVVNGVLGGNGALLP